MKVAILIPDRNDRPKFLAHCLKMIKAQTRQPDIIEIVNDPSSSDDIDITWRYMIGYKRIGDRADLVLFIENDDYYAPNYIETMVNAWIAAGKPQLIGCTYTIYYNIMLKKWFRFRHHVRCSMMCTGMVTGLDLYWGNLKDPYTDSHIWLKCGLTRHLITPEPPICIGIKHGIGLTGGLMHSTKLHMYNEEDPDLELLKNWVDLESFNFYNSIICDLH